MNQPIDWSRIEQGPTGLVNCAQCARIPRLAHARVVVNEEGIVCSPPITCSRPPSAVLTGLGWEGRRLENLFAPLPAGGLGAADGREELSAYASARPASHAPLVVCSAPRGTGTGEFVIDTAWTLRYVPPNDHLAFPPAIQGGGTRKPFSVPTISVVFFNSMMYQGLDRVSRRGLLRTRCQI